jgi:hypothetical protein
MAFLPGFLADIFVSYSHIDNEPFGPDQIRWVSKFHGHLGTRIHALLGKPVTIWRDNKTTGAEIFSDETLEQLRGSAILVSIMTPAYLASEWCKREVDEFIAPDGATRDLRLGNKSRVVKVVKTLVPRAQLLPIFDNMLGYEFYKQEAETEVAREFLLDPGPEGVRLYFAKLDDVAHEIRRLIELMAGRPPQGVSLPIETRNPPPVNPTSVYLASSSSDIQSHTDQLRRELEDRGFAVLPDKPLPLSAAQITELVRQHLARSALAIHPLGTRYGFVPEDEDRSIVEIQYGLSLQHAEANFRCVVWIPPCPPISDERLRALLTRIRDQPEGSRHVEIVETSIEGLKNFVIDRLNRQISAEKATAKSIKNGDRNTSIRRVYLMHDQRDGKAVTPLRDYLHSLGLEVIRPLMAGKPQQLRKDHQENLLMADGVLIYWGMATEAWLREKMRDLIRIRGLGRTTPFRARAIYIDDPQAQEKQDFTTHEAEMMRSSGASLPQALRPFIAELAINP